MDVRIDGHEGQTALAKSASPTNNSVIGCKRLRTGWGLGDPSFLCRKPLGAVFASRHSQIIQPPISDCTVHTFPPLC